jgi:tripartite-type tricarboxylate transporter receptor subunit TctC
MKSVKFKSLHLLLVFSALIATGLNAQTFPDRAVKIIAPNPPGGPNDMVARLIGQKLSELWGEQSLLRIKLGLVAI